MQSINYFFVSVISFLGLLVGIILVKIAPEEQKPLAKKFSLARKFFLFSVLIPVAFYSYNQLNYLLILLASFMVLFYLEYKIDDIAKRNIAIYFILGVVFFLSSNNTNLFVIESTLILLYGVITSSLIYKIKQKNLKEIFLYNVVFVIIANLLNIFQLPFLIPHF